ncbi:MAG: metallophosphoesterase [Clostridia bacterium]|nr:metallophosphoesterase [Clostridia bacterium]
MKKIISVLLALTMIFSMGILGVSAEEVNELRVTVANDLHYSHDYKSTNTNTTYTADYANKVSTGQLRLENELIIDEFLTRVQGDVLLIPGDITDNGTETEHAYMAAKLEAFEEATGKSVFLVPGNHDYMQHRGGKMNAEKIKANYFALCYGEAITVDSETASYVADLDGEYRLLAIDATTKPGGNQNLDERLYSWIEAQLKAAKADGKKVIAISHYNLLEHLIMMDKIHAGSVLTSSLGLPELFAQYNVKYTFTGHTHEHDIVAYTGANGNTIYDVVTTTINAYPCSYREVVFGEKVKFETKFIEKIDTASLKGKITDATYNLATENFLEYSYNMFIEGMKPVVLGFVTTDKVTSMLGIDKEAEIYSTIDTLVAKLNELIRMPLYKADETEEGKSIESIIAKYDLTLPATEHKDVITFVEDIYLAHIVGDESYGVLTQEYSMLVSTFTGIFNYLLSDISGEEYAQVMTYACSFLGADIPVDFFKYAGSGVSKAQGIDIFVTAVASPVLLMITTDEGTPDNNVTLEGYEAAYEEAAELTVWEKIVNFFKNFFAYIARILGF